MRYLISILLIIFTLIDCAPNEAETKEKADTLVQDNVLEAKALQTILDVVKVDGTILIYDPQKDKYYTNNTESTNEPAIPASTFKIVNSIIGLETKIIKDTTTVFEWDKKPRYLPIWEQDLNLKAAFQASCVPCYQELARKIGATRMQQYLDKLDFGQMELDHASIDNFWLIGDSKISPVEQIDFLNRLYTGGLDISKHTQATMMSIMKLEENSKYILSGKTGLAVNEKRPVGWFVGYVEKGDEVVFFATKISPKEKEFSNNQLMKIRKEVTIAGLRKLNIIPSLKD